MGGIKLKAGRSSKSRFPLRTVNQLNARGRHVQVTSEQNSQRSASQGKRMPEAIKAKARGTIPFIACEKQVEWRRDRTLRIDRYRPYMNASIGEFKWERQSLTCSSLVSLADVHWERIEVSDAKNPARPSLWAASIDEESGLRSNCSAYAGLGYRVQLSHLQSGGCGYPSSLAVSESGATCRARPMAQPAGRGIHSDWRVGAQYSGHREDGDISTSRLLSLVGIQHYGRQPAGKCAWHPCVR